MPVVDGVEATRRIMAESPCAIVVVTSSVSGHLGKVYEAMGLGALDAVDTPELGPSGDVAGARLMLEKIATVAKLLGRSPRVGPGLGRPARAGRAGPAGRPRPGPWWRSAARPAAPRRWPRSSPGSPT